MCSLLYMKGFDLFFSFSTSLSPDLGREGTQLENGIQDLFPFHIKNLDKMFTDGSVYESPCQKNNTMFSSELLIPFYAVV